MAADLLIGEESRERDPDRAKHMLIEAARLNDVSAMKQLGDLSMSHERREGAYGDDAKIENEYYEKQGLQSYERATETGAKSTNPSDVKAGKQAAKALGDIYMHGKAGKQVDEARAKTYYQQSGTAESLKALGDIHREGKAGEPVDEAKAKSYYEKSGTPAAMKAIGDILVEGKGNIGRDKLQALGMWSKAAAAGSEAARLEIERLKAQVPLSQITSPAFKLRQLLCVIGHGCLP